MTALPENISHVLQQEFFHRYPADAARYVEEIPLERAAALLNDLSQGLAGKVWERLSPRVAADLLERLSDAALSRILSGLDPNRAALILAASDASQRERYLAVLPPHIRQDCNRAMLFPADSAGAMMDTSLSYYTPEMTVRAALDKLRRRRQPGSRVLFVTDGDNKLVGSVEIQELALVDDDIRLTELLQPLRAVAQATTTREELVKLFETHRLVELPVLDGQGRLIGIIRHHVLVGATKEEAIVDIQTMVGVSKDERAFSSAWFAIKKRLPWLQINLATAFLAAMVIGVFEQTIVQVTALAVLLPVVAGQSGNTGAQAMAVAMRGLALHEVWPRQWLQLVGKEFTVGLWNGVAVALTTSLGVYIWSQSAGLCLIIALSMVVSMIIASVSGALIPILLIKAGQDPATSSSIFLTTVTDVVGFFSFLGIATLLLGIL